MKTQNICQEQTEELKFEHLQISKEDLPTKRLEADVLAKQQTLSQAIISLAAMKTEEVTLQAVDDVCHAHSGFERAVWARNQHKELS